MPKIIELSGIVGWDITAKGLKNRFPKDNGDVYLKVDSVGGSVFEGNRLYNTILDYPGKIIVEFGAIAASAASYFPLAVGKENIVVRENTTFMGHKAWGYTIGNADEMQIDVDILNGLDRLIAKVYSKITNKTIDDTLEDMKNEFWLIGGQQIVDAGFASSIVENSDSENTDPENVIEKSEIVAMIKEAKNTLQEIVAEEDLNKWAAKLKINKADNIVKENQLDLFNNLPLSGENLKPEDSKMNLTEYLNSNPEAKAEHEKLIKAAKTEGIENAVTEDRERFAEVLNKSGIIIPENVLKNAKTMTVGDFAIAELDRRNEAIKKQGDKPQDMGGLKPTNQVPERPEGDEEKTGAEKKIDNAIDKIVGKKAEVK